MGTPVATKPEERGRRRRDDVELSTDDRRAGTGRSPKTRLPAAMTTASSATSQATPEPAPGSHCTKSRRKPRQRCARRRSWHAQVAAPETAAPRTEGHSAPLLVDVVGARHGDRRRRARHAAHAPVPAPPSRGTDLERAQSAPRQQARAHDPARSRNRSERAPHRHATHRSRRRPRRSRRYASLRSARARSAPAPDATQPIPEMRYQVLGVRDCRRPPI